MTTDLKEKLSDCKKMHVEAADKWRKKGNEAMALVHELHASTIDVAITTLSKPRGRTSPGIDTDGFAKFWQAYPRKVGKGDARRAWVQMKCEPQTHAIIEAIRNAKRSYDWQKERGNYIPHPATWIRREGWFDVLDQTQQTQQPVSVAPITGQYRIV